MLLPLESATTGLTRASGGLFVAAAATLSRSGESACAYSISGSACSPPRTVTKISSGTVVTAPSRTVVASKRKRHRPSADSGDHGGDDDGPGNGGNWGEGWNNNDDGDDSRPWQVHNLWAWQAICIGSLLQAAQYLMMQQQQRPEAQGPRSIKFAAVSSASS